VEPPGPSTVTLTVPLAAIAASLAATESVRLVPLLATTVAVSFSVPSQIVVPVMKPVPVAVRVNALACVAPAVGTVILVSVGAAVIVNVAEVVEASAELPFWTVMLGVPVVTS
jgi:hypothetical protein